jgi:hypothetical protein
MKNFLLMILAILLVSVFSIIGIIINTVRKLYRLDNISDYFKTVALGFDQVGGSIIYGKEDWTVSSWTYYLHRLGNIYATCFMKVIDFFFGELHCEESFRDEARVLKFDVEWL